MLIGVYYPEMKRLTLPFIVMEKMYSSLRGLVENRSDIPFNVTLSILNDVCRALQYLHSRKPPIVHWNLTPNNILLCYHFKAKLSDIGVSNTLQTADAQVASQAPGLNGFSRPKSLTSISTEELSLDIFALGRIILYITTHQWPQLAPLINFDPDVSKRTSTELERHQQYLDMMTERYTNLKPLVLSCLDDNPQNRPSVAQALKEIKQVKVIYNQMLCSLVWGTEEPPEQEEQQEVERKVYKPENKSLQVS